MNKFLSHKMILIMLALCLYCCFLTGCPSPVDESKEAEDHVELAIPMAEEALKRTYPFATIVKKSFHGVSGIKIGPDHGLTDWVEGQYKNGGLEDILINVKTQEIYTTNDRFSVNHYAMKRAIELYNADSVYMDGSVEFSFEAPYCSDSDKYGNILISNMLPIDTVANEDFVYEMLDNAEYHKTYHLLVNEDFDMNIFKETDYSPLGNNVRLYVEQYSDEYLKRKDTPGFVPEQGSDVPIAIFDSENEED